MEKVATIPYWMLTVIGTSLTMLVGLVAFFLKRALIRLDAIERENRMNADKDHRHCFACKEELRQEIENIRDAFASEKLATEKTYAKQAPCEETKERIYRRLDSMSENLHKQEVSCARRHGGETR